MLQRVTMEGLSLPRLYIAENNEDVELARRNGIPYIKWKKGMDSLIKALLRPTLEKMFPGINWNIVLGRKVPVRSEVVLVGGHIDDDEHMIAEYDKDAMLDKQLEYDKHVDELGHDWSEPDEDGEHTRLVDIAESERDCIMDMSDAGYSHFTEDKLSVYDFVGDLSSSVDIEVLQKLKLLPQFVGDVADCIKRNLSNNMYWTEGYTKKLGVPLGNFKNRGELPNLIIIDVSCSIPDGIASTMLSLADTLREECNAELIITSRRSGYYPIGSELPSPQTLRDYYGRSNESAEFMAILEKHIAGREFGHVISFGDNDCPGSINKFRREYRGEIESIDMANTKVHMLHSYHTWQDKVTGYARWVTECCPDVEVEIDTSWCKVCYK